MSFNQYFTSVFSVYTIFETFADLLGKVKAGGVNQSLDTAENNVGCSKNTVPLVSKSLPLSIFPVINSSIGLVHHFFRCHYG